MDAFKTITLIAITAVISSGTTYHIAQRDSSALASASAAKTVPSHQSHEVQDACKPQENMPAQQSVSSIPNQIKAHSTGNPSTSSPAEVQPERVAPDELRWQIQQQQEHVDAFRNFLAAHDSDSPLDAVKKKYDGEPLNYEWASQKENALVDLFDKHDGLASFAPLELSCKSVNCRIVMAVQDEHQADEIYHSLLSAVSRDGEASGEETVSYFADPQNGQIVMYVSTDNGEALFN